MRRGVRCPRETAPTSHACVAWSSRSPLLSACEGDRALTRGDDTVATKAPVPAAKPGRLVVEGVGFPKLQTGGELVELKVQVTPDRVEMIKR